MPATMPAQRQQQDLGVGRLLLVAVRQIAERYDLPGVDELTHELQAGMHTTPLHAAAVGKLCTDYRAVLADLAETPQGAHLVDAMLLAVRQALSLLTHAQGTRREEPGVMHWTLLVLALVCAALKPEHGDAAKLQELVDELNAKIRQV